MCTNNPCAIVRSVLRLVLITVLAMMFDTVIGKVVSIKVKDTLRSITVMRRLPAVTSFVGADLVMPTAGENF